MAQIKLLTNQTRAILRPPLLVTIPNGAMLAEILPVVKKPAQNSFDSSSQTPKSARPVGGTAPATPPSVSKTPPPNPTFARGPGLRSGYQAPRAPSLRAPGTGESNPQAPAPQRPGTNGKPASPPAANGTRKNGVGFQSALFQTENIRTASGRRPVADPRDRFRPASVQSVKPPVLSQSSRNGPPAAPQQNSGENADPPSPARQAREPGDPHENIRRLLKTHNDLPAQSAVLGVDDNDYPVILDLNDPAPGAVIVIGDERNVLLELLRGVVASAAMRNSPHSLQILIFSVDPQSWKRWISAHGYDRFCLSIEGVDDVDLLRDWILRLGDWTEQRRLGQRSGPPVLLVMDTLSFLPRLAYDVRLNFEWMAKEGPPAQIWPVAAISTELAQLLNSRRMLRAFQTRILGYAGDPSFYVQLAGLSEQEAAEFIRPGRFAVRLSDAWLEFGLPGQG